jgi:F-type H+-transporting ATPase subunit gamma
MPTLNEVKEQMIVVGSVAEFTNALQQIATIHMVKLRDKVVASRPFVQVANEMLMELSGIRNGMTSADLLSLERKGKRVKGAALPAPAKGGEAVIVISSNQGLTGPYNQEVFKRAQKVMAEKPAADYFVIGKKGIEYFGGKKVKVKSYPYQVPEDFNLEHLQSLISLFDYYSQITLVYSHYLNSAKRDVVAVSIVAPSEDELVLTERKGTGAYTFEPDINELISGVSQKLRAALFQQQLLDARLAQNSSQMVGMKTASDNATGLLADLRQEYNKQRRKMIDKKIGEVFAGSALW